VAAGEAEDEGFGELQAPSRLLPTASELKVRNCRRFRVIVLRINASLANFLTLSACNEGDPIVS
jgi:hypothetical protein